MQIGYRGDKNPEFLQLQIRDDGYDFKIESGSSLTVGAYGHYAFTQDAVAMKLYIDGAEDTSAVYSKEEAPMSRSSWLAQLDDSNPVDQPALGMLRRNTDVAGVQNAIIDEFRIAKTALSADCITTEYNNQNDNGAFWVATDVGGGGGGAVLPQFLGFAGL
jgi:hypothetical protein